MPVVVDGVFPVHVLPALAGEELVLSDRRAGGKAQREALVQPLHLLQEYDVRVERAEALAQLVDHHAPVESGQALVDVERDDTDRLRGHGATSSSSSAKRRSTR